MLSKPHHGWLDITIGDFIGRGSYIQDIPVLFLEAFIRALAYNIPATIEIDEEDSSFTIFAHRATTITVCRAEKESRFFDIDVRTLAEELLNDLNEYHDEWLKWPPEVPHLSERDRSFFLKKRSAQLTRLTNELKKRLS